MEPGWDIMPKAKALVSEGHWERFHKLVPVMSATLQELTGTFFISTQSDVPHTNKFTCNYKTEHYNQSQRFSKQILDDLKSFKCF